jgi:hypothetical protein
MPEVNLWPANQHRGTDVQRTNVYFVFVDTANSNSCLQHVVHTRGVVGFTQSPRQLRLYLLNKTFAFMEVCTILTLVKEREILANANYMKHEYYN